MIEHRLKRLLCIYRAEERAAGKKRIIKCQISNFWSQDSFTRLKIGEHSKSFCSCGFMYLVNQSYWADGTAQFGFLCTVQRNQGCQT